MITFHRLPTFSTLIKSVFSSERRSSVADLFPHNTTHLVDSGTSAFALAIEELGLQGAHIALPAFLCDDLAPVLKHYHITPYFLDIDPENFQPPLHAYKTLPLDINAVLLVKTYGNPIEKEVYEILRAQSIEIIEDRAHSHLPLEAEEIKADACIYSLSKTATTPDGGIAITPPGKKRAFSKNPFSLSFLRNLLKLIRPLNILITLFKTQSSVSVESEWEEIHKPHPLSIALLNRYMQHRRSTPEQYCYPFYTKDPQRAKKVLISHGIAAERIWNTPIALSYQGDLKEYPHTRKASESVICVPGWHIKNQQEEETYLTHLKEILSDNLA